MSDMTHTSVRCGECGEWDDHRWGCPDYGKPLGDDEHDEEASLTPYGYDWLRYERRKEADRG